jgi:hypothetical protein
LTSRPSVFTSQPPVNKLRALRAWLPAGLVELWEEQHPGTAVQLQLPLAA